MPASPSAPWLRPSPSLGGRTAALLLRLIITIGLVAGLATLGVESSWAQPLPSESCRTEADASRCDVDRDRILDVVERVVCDDLTCADGSEDSDGDGIADWVEVMACDSVRCAGARSDSDDDGVPDFAETLTCGSTTCSDARENRDADSATDWAEVVICGDPTCANGLEDYDADGIADAAELQACVRESGGLALTGVTIAWIAFATALALVMGGVLLRIRRQRIMRHAGEMQNASGIAADEPAALGR